MQSGKSDAADAESRVEREPGEAARCVRVPEEFAGRRLDQALAALFPEWSRSRLTAWVREGRVSVDGAPRRARDPVRGGETIRFVPVLPVVVAAAPESIPLAIVYEDAAILVIDKPAGLVVHPGAGRPAGTLLNALLAHAPELAVLPRAGIVHRIDRDTTGLLVVARTAVAYHALARQLAERTVHREYEALVHGVLTSGGSVDAPIGRHHTDRKRMAVKSGGRESITHYRVVDRYRCHTRIRVNLETGRTHQIRVHMAHLHHPIVGDPVYGGRMRVPPDADPDFMAVLHGFRRQALHAARLVLKHPVTKRERVFETPLPADFAVLVDALERDRSRKGG